MLGEPHRVIAGGILDDLEALDGALGTRRKLDLAIRPAEELQNPNLHDLPEFEVRYINWISCLANFKFEKHTRINFF